MDSISDLVAGRVQPAADGTWDNTYKGDVQPTWLAYQQGDDCIAIDGSLTAAELLALASWIKQHQTE